MKEENWKSFGQFKSLSLYIRENVRSLSFKVSFKISMIAFEVGYFISKWKVGKLVNQESPDRYTTWNIPKTLPGQSRKYLNQASTRATRLIRSLRILKNTVLERGWNHMRRHLESGWEIRFQIPSIRFVLWTWSWMYWQTWLKIYSYSLIPYLAYYYCDVRDIVQDGTNFKFRIYNRAKALL